MSGLPRIALFAALLALVFGGAVLLGGAADPDADEAGAMAGGHDEGTTAEHGGGGEHGKAAEHGARAAHGGGEKTETLPGLAVAQGGLRLEIDRRRLQVGAAERFEFRILDASGRPIRSFQKEQDRRMHLIVVRRDLHHFQHVHPRMARDGTWSVALTLPAAGTYRAFADFQVAGQKRTLGQDLFAAGRFQPRALPAVADGAEVDGYKVSLTGSSSGELDFTVRRGGKLVKGLQPYLGARGHLVALREGDLAYLHTHPEKGTLSFAAEYPTPGRYRLFLQFRHEDTVHTAAFTQEKNR